MAAPKPSSLCQNPNHKAFKLSSNSAMAVHLSLQPLINLCRDHVTTTSFQPSQATMQFNSPNLQTTKIQSTHSINHGLSHHRTTISRRCSPWQLLCQHLNSNHGNLQAPQTTIIPSHYIQSCYLVRTQPKLHLQIPNFN
jgi:hypothetical protein